MSPKTLTSSRHAIDSCTFQLHSWRPFHLPTTFKTIDNSDTTNNPTYSSSSKSYSGTTIHKRPCLSDRPTSFSIETLDMSRLSLFDDDGSRSSVKSKCQRIHWMARKRRRRGSRSLSGRSSDRSGRRRRCCSVGASAAYATCSDFMVANAGTDSSGELFVNGGGSGGAGGGGDVNWASDASEAAARNLRRESGGVGGGSGGEREVSAGVIGLHHHWNLDNQGNESGYGSETGYRGDVELGYGDELDEEEDDSRLLFWGNRFGDTDSNMEMVGENTLQKAHHRCRRKKHDLRMVDAV